VSAPRQRGKGMIDVVLIGFTVALFVLMFAYVRGCERLR
jgi:hypothetical protein